MRRPSLRSTLHMSLLAAGMVLAGVLIWRGAGAPREPARLVIPGRVGMVKLADPGRYIIFTEQVVAPRAAVPRELRPPRIELEVMSLETGKPVPVEETGMGSWLHKVLTRRRGHSLGTFVMEKAGEVAVRGRFAKETPETGELRLVLAFARAASPGRFLWLLVGFGGQICFTLRFLVQWLASERTGRSTVPRAFWYYSLFGGLMILAYAIYTRDPVFIMAYAFNAFIYVRNLVLIRREDRASAQAAAADEA